MMEVRADHTKRLQARSTTQTSLLADDRRLRAQHLRNHQDHAGVCSTHTTDTRPCPPPTHHPSPLAMQVCDDCLKTGAQARPHPPTQAQTPSSLTHDRLLVSPCSQITPKSAQALSHHHHHHHLLHDAHAHTRAPQCAGADTSWRPCPGMQSAPHAQGCLGRSPCPKPFQVAVLQEGRDGALQRAQAVPCLPITLLATPLHNPFQVRALLAGAHAALPALPAPSHAH